MKPYYSGSGVTLYHGDCREVLPDVAPVDLVVTDPPYAFGSSRPEWRITASVAIGVNQAALKVKKAGALAVMTAASGRGIEYVQGAVGSALPFNRLLIWHKTSVRTPVAGPWRWDIVPVLLFGKATFGRAGASSCFISGGHSSVDSDHPAALPEGLDDWLVGPFVESRTLLDPFMGAGTFVVAGRKAGKRVIGIDSDEKHCEEAASRLDQGSLFAEVTS